MPEYNCFDWDRSIDHPAKPVPAPSSRSTQDADYLILLFLLSLATIMAGCGLYLLITHAPSGVCALAWCGGGPARITAYLDRKRKQHSPLFGFLLLIACIFLMGYALKIAEGL